MGNERFVFCIIKKRKINIEYFKLYLQMILFLIQMKYIIIQETSEIRLIIDGGGGEQNILNNGFDNNPSEVWVNDSLYTSYSKTCDLPTGLSEVTLKFDDQLESCSEMFKDLNNLKEVNLSDFDASKVASMKSMFYGCSNLEKITFGNINTSSVTDLGQFLQGCSRLSSIDLINLDTSKVTNFAWMFFSCHNLESINFGSIDTSNVESTWCMFYECQNLKSVDLSNLKLSKLNYMQTMFDG